MNETGSKTQSDAPAWTRLPGTEGASSQTMLKGLAILEWVAAHPGTLAVGEIASDLGLDKSTTSRLLAALRAAGYVRQGKDRRYQLTSKLLFLTRNFVPAEHLRDVARHASESIHEALDEAIHVAAVDAGEIVFVDFLDSSHAVRSQTPTVPSPLHLTAIGRAALSRMPPDRRATSLRESAAAAAVPLHTVDTPQLRSALDSAAERGFATFGEGTDVIRVGAAIVDRDGEVIGGMSVSGPAYRLESRIDEIGELLATTAAKVQG